MPSRFIYGTQFIKKSFNDVPIQIVEMDEPIYDTWERVVTPEIKKEKCRADFNWDWRRLVRRYSAGAKYFFNQEPVTLAMAVFDGQNNTVAPVGMMLLVKKYSALKDIRKNTFIWFLAAAPDSAIQKMLPHWLWPKGIGTLLIDTAITVSINSGNKGRIALHAAPQEVLGCTDLLFDWYSRKLKLSRYPNNGRIANLLRKNDGRYFYASRADALYLAQKLDSLR